MRVSISHATVQRGLLFRTTFYVVRLSVAFTHEETQIIRQRGLLATKLMDRRPATARVDDRDEKFALYVGHLMNRRVDRFEAATPSAAKLYEAELLQMLEELKMWIDDNAETGARTVIEF